MVVVTQWCGEHGARSGREGLGEVRERGPRVSDECEVRSGRERLGGQRRV